MSFSSLKLHPQLQAAIEQEGYKQPTDIQLQAIPKILAGHDVLASAQTGTGKTAAFALPLIHRLAEGERAKANRTRALVLTPTRELAAQVGDKIKAYAATLPVSCYTVFGGVKINPQMMRLRRGVDVLVATPGRLFDLHENNAIKLNQVEYLVLDEADKMLDMGFLPDIERLLELLPSKRQSLLFSATFSPAIKTLANQLLNKPHTISVSAGNSTAKTVTQRLHPVDKKRKSELLIELINDNQWFQVLVFCRTKKMVNKVVYDLQKAGIDSEAIHSDKSQGARTRVLKAFKQGALAALVATDVAARGLDIQQLPQVVNFELPNVPEDYIHRIGRTGRAGESGNAISLVSADEIDYLRKIERLTQKLIKRVFVDGFEPDHSLPESKLLPKQKKKPHKKKLAKAKERAADSKNKTSNKKPKSTNARKAVKKRNRKTNTNSSGKANGRGSRSQPSSD